MRTVTLRNLAAHRVRLILTVLSVVLGTAFVAGSYVFTDTLQSSFDGIVGDQARGVDVRVEPKQQLSVGVSVQSAAAVAAVPGVRAVAAGITSPVLLLHNGRAVQTGAAGALALSYVPADKAVSPPPKFVAGAPPAHPGQVALDATAARRAGLALGDPLQLLLPESGTVPMTITGLFESHSGAAGFFAVLVDDGQARKLFTDGEHVPYLDIAAAPGVSPAQLRNRIAAVLPQDKVLVGDQVRAELKTQIGTALKFVDYFLLAFGAIGLLVGTFLIYNTFSMIVAQRLRELALLRAVGASRSQIATSVVAEASVIGVFGSVVGLGCGIGLAFGLSQLLSLFHVALPTGALRVLPRTVVVTLLLGVVVTVVSAFAPARRAARIPPVQAMREEFASPEGSLRVRTVVGSVFAVAGIAAVVVGMRGSGGHAAGVVGGGALALIVAVLWAGPALSRPLLLALGLLLRPFGPVGRMARDNAVRNPRRTAATAFALTLGLMLVSAVAMLGASATASVNDLVDKGIRADFALSTPQQILGVPPEAEQAARSVPGVRQAVGFRRVVLKVGDKQITGASPDGPIAPVLRLNLRHGLANLGSGQLLASETQAAQSHWRLGERVVLTSLDNTKFTLTVAGIYQDNQLIGPLLVAPELFEQAMPVLFRSDIVVLIDAAPGTNLRTLRHGLEQATAGYVVVQVADRTELKGTQAKQIDTLLGIIYGLLALAVVIAVLGIVNTLGLSVVERRREIGMLRAVGMARSQVRRAIYLESVLIAVFGALSGVVLGLGCGAGFLRTLRTLGVNTIAVPWNQILLMVVATAFVGVLAALWPAVRAARTPPLAALAEL